MQDRGLTPNLEKLCESFNLSLGTMLGDLDVYLYGNLDKNLSPDGYSSGGQFDSDVKNFLLEKLDGKDSEQELKHSDRAEVENYLRKCSMDNINRRVGNAYFVLILKMQCLPMCSRPPNPTLLHPAGLLQKNFYGGQCLPSLLALQTIDIAVISTSPIL